MEEGQKIYEGAFQFQASAVRLGAKDIQVSGNTWTWKVACQGSIRLYRILYAANQQSQPLPA